MTNTTKDNKTVTTPATQPVVETKPTTPPTQAVENNATPDKVAESAKESAVENASDTKSSDDTLADSTASDESPKFDPKLYVKLAYEIKQAQSEAKAVTLGNSSLSSQDQSNRKGKRGDIAILMIRKYQPDIATETIKLGDPDPSDNSKVIGKGDERIGKLNAIGQANSDRIDLLNKEYDDPKESYSNPNVQSMVHNGVLLRTGNLILKAYFAGGVADKVVGLHLIRRIAKWSVEDRDAVYNELKTLTVGDESLAKIDRVTIETLADSTYDALAKMHGFNAVVKSSAKSSAPTKVSLDDLDSMDLSNQVTEKKPKTPSQTTAKESESDSSAEKTVKPTFDPAANLSAAKQVAEADNAKNGVNASTPATPPIVSSTVEKIDDKTQLAAIEAAKESEKKIDPDNSDDKEKKTDETKTESAK